MCVCMGGGGGGGGSCNQVILLEVYMGSQCIYSFFGGRGSGKI